MPAVAVGMVECHGTGTALGDPIEDGTRQYGLPSWESVPRFCVFWRQEPWQLFWGPPKPRHIEPSQQRSSKLKHSARIRCGWLQGRPILGTSRLNALGLQTWSHGIRCARLLLGSRVLLRQGKCFLPFQVTLILTQKLFCDWTCR